LGHECFRLEDSVHGILDFVRGKNVRRCVYILRKFPWLRVGATSTQRVEQAGFNLVEYSFGIRDLLVQGGGSSAVKNDRRRRTCPDQWRRGQANRTTEIRRRHQD